MLHTCLGGTRPSSWFIPSQRSSWGIGRTSKPSSCPTHASRPPRCRCGPRGCARGLGCRTSCGFGAFGPLCQRTKRVPSLCLARSPCSSIVATFGLITAVLSRRNKFLNWEDLLRWNMYVRDMSLIKEIQVPFKEPLFWVSGMVSPLIFYTKNKKN